MGDVVHATLATIPSRAAFAPRAIASLHGQVDELHVALDSPAVRREDAWFADLQRAVDALTYRGTPWYAASSDYGDAAKLVPWSLTSDATGSQTVVLVCDDDIEYPHDYVWWMVNHLREAEKLAGKHALVSLHGLALPERSPTYRRHRRELQHCLAPQHAYWDQPRASSLRSAHVLGTGVLAARVETLERFLDEGWSVSHVRNALDLHLARWAEREGVPRFVAPLRREGFLENLLPKDAPSIWADAETAKEDALVSDVTWRPL